MNDDTRTTPAATRAADNASLPEARRAERAAALVGEAVHERLIATARLAVAVGLADAGAERFAGLTGIDDRFPEGSDYGALCPQDDLSRAQAEVIYRDTRTAVQAEADRMTRDAPGRAAVIARQLAAWEEGGALEWADMERIREEYDQEDAAGDALLAARASSAPLSPKPVSPGARYVAEYLPDLGDHADPWWIAESVDDGRLMACPRCHFLHLPVNPFPLRPFEIERHGPPLDACDVCASVPLANVVLELEMDWAKVFRSAPDELIVERKARAITLFNLFMSASNGADALRMAAFAEAERALMRQVRPGREAAR